MPLIAGCNPVTWTGPDGAPAGMVGAYVDPAESLVALWAFKAAVWLGYWPRLPEVSDQMVLDRLDVVFVCTNAPGTFAYLVI